MTVFLALLRERFSKEGKIERTVLTIVAEFVLFHEMFRFLTVRPRIGYGHIG